LHTMQEVPIYIQTLVMKMYRKMHSSPSSHPLSPPKWLRLLKIMYNVYRHGALTVSELWNINEIRRMLSSKDALRMQLRSLIYNGYRNRYVYPIPPPKDFPHGPKKYIISISGLTVLRRKGLIDENHELAARRRLLGIIEEVMPPGRYNRIISNMKRR